MQNEDIIEKLCESFGLSELGEMELRAYTFEVIKRATVHAEEKHSKEINRILNMHSKPISEGGIDYVKAFEEMKKYEQKLIHK